MKIKFLFVLMYLQSLLWGLGISSNKNGSRVIPQLQDIDQCLSSLYSIGGSIAANGRFFLQLEKNKNEEKVENLERTKRAKEKVAALWEDYSTQFESCSPIILTSWSQEGLEISGILQIKTATFEHHKIKETISDLLYPHKYEVVKRLDPEKVLIKDFFLSLKAFFYEVQKIKQEALRNRYKGYRVNNNGSKTIKE